MQTALAAAEKQNGAGPEFQRFSAMLHAMQHVHLMHGACEYPLCQDPWYRSSALAHAIGPAAHEGRGHRARQ